MRNAVDEAVDEFQRALEELRGKDDKSLVVLYDSKAQAEFSTAVLLEGAGKADAAREAYGRALQEDLAYYPAHMRLGLLALGQSDTAAAISELALAAQIAPAEPFIRYMNGYVLGKTNHAEEAIVELTKAIELEPYFALPNLILGTQYEVLAKGPEALAAYERFLATAGARDPQRDFATRRVEDIKEFLKAPNTQ
jgi:tetratricopeptide (TPR) repeat protein